MIDIWYTSGDNKELSNLAIRYFTFNSMEFNSVEQAYQLAKGCYAPNTPKNSDLMDKIIATTSGVSAKYFGSKYHGLNTYKWNKDRFTLMYQLMFESFKQNPDAKAMLLATGDIQLTHTKAKGVWRTMFPELLMKVREELSHD